MSYQRPVTSPAYVLPNYAVPLDLNHQTLGQRQLIRAPGGSQFLVGGQEAILSQNPHTLISTGLHRVSFDNLDFIFDFSLGSPTPSTQFPAWIAYSPASPWRAAWNLTTERTTWFL